MSVRSRGCQTCKKRRIKCDEARPICTQCKKSNRVCKDFGGDENGLIFLSENVFAGGRPRRPRFSDDKYSPGLPVKKSSTKKRNRARVEPTISTKSSAIISKHASSQQIDDFLGIQMPLKIPLEDQAVGYYILKYLDMSNDIQEILHGNLNCIPFHWAKASSNSILHLAMTAVSCTLFGRAREVPMAITVGHEKYLQTIHETKVAIENGTQVTCDELILATTLLNIYENYSLHKGSQENAMTRSMYDSGTYPQIRPDVKVHYQKARTFWHSNGSMALLKIRAQQERKSKSSLQIDKLIRRQSIRSCILQGTDVPSWLLDGTKFGEEGLSLELYACMAHVAHIRHRGLSILRTLDLGDLIDEEQIHELVNDALEADERLVRWSTSIPSDWMYSTHILQSEAHHQTNPFFRNIVHVYPTIGNVITWNRYRAIRMVVNNTIIRLLSASGLSDSNSIAQLELARMKMQDCIDDLCDSLPFYFGLVSKVPETGEVVLTKWKDSVEEEKAFRLETACLMAWPLTIAATDLGQSQRQQNWIRSQILLIANLSGDGILAALATKSVRIF